MKKFGRSHQNGGVGNSIVVVNGDGNANVRYEGCVEFDGEYDEYIRLVSATSSCCVRAVGSLKVEFLGGFLDDIIVSDCVDLVVGILGNYGRRRRRR